MGKKLKFVYLEHVTYMGIHVSHTGIEYNEKRGEWEITGFVGVDGIQYNLARTELGILEQGEFEKGTVGYLKQLRNNWTMINY